MLSKLFLTILSASSVLALPGLRFPKHHHHAKRDDVVVYATVQVTEYITMTAGQPEATAVDADKLVNLAVLATPVSSVVPLTTLATSTSTPATSSLSTSIIYHSAISPSSTSTIPSSSPSSVSSSAPTASASSTGSSSGKRGIAWPGNNPSSMTSLFDVSAISWYFNWGTTATTGLSSTFIYEQWGSNNIDNVNSLPNGATLIGFNEPDGSGQATMTAAQAAAYYKSTFTPLRKSGAIGSLGTPSITNGGSPAGITWLTEFMTLCSDCEIDFVSAHWYGPTLTLLQSQMTAIHTAFNLPIWITEMACTEWSESSNPTQAQVDTFMSDAMSWMDSTEWIAKYAWFGAMIITDSSLGTSNMLVTSDGSALSALGKQYLSA